MIIIRCESGNFQCASWLHWYGKQSVIWVHKRNQSGTMTTQHLLHSFNFKKTGQKNTAVLILLLPLREWLWSVVYFFFFKEISSKFCKQLFVLTSLPSSRLYRWVKMFRESNCRPQIHVEEELPLKCMLALTLQTNCFAMSSRKSITFSLGYTDSSR